MSSPITDFFSTLWSGIKTAEAKAVLPILANTATNVANNPTELNLLAQMASAAAQIEAAQPAILQAELQSVAGMLQQVAASVGAPSASTKGTGSPAGAGA